MAESLLHRIKGQTQLADMHFESHFYASVHFGLGEQLDARRDPHRFTYLSLDSQLRPEQLSKELFEGYTPEALRRSLREAVLEAKSEGSQALREKLLDWLRANIPPGFRSSS